VFYCELHSAVHGKTLIPFSICYNNHESPKKKPLLCIFSLRVIDGVSQLILHVDVDNLWFQKKYYSHKKTSRIAQSQKINIITKFIPITFIKYHNFKLL
jgi:hypothetical protein